MMSTTIEPGKIFNVPEPTGTDVARAETTAAQAQIDAPTNSTARMTERNAETMQGAAEEAALMARSLGKETTGEPPSAGEQLRSKSETAIAHGKADIVKAMDEMQEYLGQAKRLPGNALEAVEPQIEKVSSYVGGVEGQTDTNNTLPQRVPATTAPLESGPHTVGGPYPDTNAKVGELGQKE